MNHAPNDTDPELPGPIGTGIFATEWARKGENCTWFARGIMEALTAALKPRDIGKKRENHNRRSLAGCVYFMLFDHADDDGRVVLTVEQIVEKLHVSIPRATEARRRLISAGLLKETGFRPDEYALCPPSPPRKEAQHG